jgi:DNA-binding NarL/FixJ family response regulator
MGSRIATLLDILSSRQFQTAILLTLGLNTQQIADLQETSDQTVCRSLRDCLLRAKCRSLEDLSARLLFESENELYDVRLKKELAELQIAARRMLEGVVSEDCAIC